MEKESIVKIENYEHGDQEGYKVTTSKQELLLTIQNRQNCCEHWGYLWCNETTTEFLNSRLLSVEVVDTALHRSILEKHLVNDDNKKGIISYGSIMFVNLETTNGTLQFIAYNEQNGCYGHDVFIKSNQLLVTETL